MSLKIWDFRGKGELFGLGSYEGLGENNSLCQKS